MKTGNTRHLLLAVIFLFISITLLAQNAPITSAATISNAVPGQPVTVAVTVTEFSNITSLNLSLNYEYAKLQYVSATNNSPFDGCTIGDIDLEDGIHHQLTINWYSLDGVTLTNGSGIVNYVFTYISGTSALVWDDINCVYTGATFTPLNDAPTSTYYINGSISGTALENVNVNARVFLEGPYSAGTMSTSLRTLGKIPLIQPYSISPWNYGGVEQVSSIPADVTDWILVELRTGTSAATTVAKRAGFLKSNGSITDLDGTSLLGFPGVSPGNYYIVIRHRNHIPILSAAAVTLSASGALYDFSLGSTQFYGGTNGCKNINIVLNEWGMVAADASCEGSIFTNDYTNFWVPSFGTTNTYNSADFNMDGNVFTNDYTNYWVPNFGKSNVLP